MQSWQTAVLAEGAVVDGELSQAISQATGVPAVADSPKTLEDLLLPGSAAPAAPPPTDQHSNQIAAFRQVYGHDPVTANDWMMAAGLDTQLYAENHGVPREIVAGRFGPQPGKGVVRSNMFIPTDEVVNAAKDLTDVGGNTTIYPSMETHQYRGGVPPEVLQWTPANSGSDVGPGTSLSRHHWIGDATIPQVRPNMPDWKWELENLNPFGGDPFTAHTTQLTDPFKGALPTVGMGH